ncbi:uncharacterized protein LOC122811427 [Protopterus annectens]|uniref:uncharacterized protein LOC122811427 n=1 Tax=Protopterus annectens TaxID=7888 RepID=UPI001CFABC1C|nr:uncharacterized protein LOC122811427 [Protopterus annectens]
MCYLSGVVKNPTLKQMARSASVKAAVSHGQMQLLKSSDRPFANRNGYDGKKNKQSSPLLLEIASAVKQTREGSLQNNSPAEVAVPVSKCKVEKDNTAVEMEAFLPSCSSYAGSGARGHYHNCVCFLTISNARRSTDYKLSGSSCGQIRSITISHLGLLQQVPIQWWKSSTGHANGIRLRQAMPEQAASVTYKDHYVQFNKGSACRITSTSVTDYAPVISSSFTAAKAQKFSGSCHRSYLAQSFLPLASIVWHCFGGTFPLAGKVTLLNLGNSHPTPLFYWRHCSRTTFGYAYSTASPGSGICDKHLEHELKKIQGKIQEAGEVLDEAKESLGTVYFSKDMEEADQLVEEAMKLYEKVLLQCSNSVQKKRMLSILGPEIEGIASRQVQLRTSVQH